MTNPTLSLPEQLAVATAQLAKVESLYLKLHEKHQVLKREFKLLLERTYPTILHGPIAEPTNPSIGT